MSRARSEAPERAVVTGQECKRVQVLECSISFIILNTTPTKQVFIVSRGSINSNSSPLNEGYSHLSSTQFMNNPSEVVLLTSQSLDPLTGNLVRFATMACILNWR